MKKKIVPFLSLIFLGATSLSLGACNQSSGTSKVYIDFGTIRTTKSNVYEEQKKTLYDDVSEKVDKKESFILIIYSSGCQCWSDFAPVLDQFIDETGCNVLCIDAIQFVDKENVFGLQYVANSRYFSNLPSIALFKRGKLTKQITYKDDTRLIFKYYENHFKKFIEENIVLPKMYYVNKEVLDNYIDTNKDFNLYVARSECPDCNALASSTLYPWSDKVESVNDKLYIFDIQEYYASERSGSTPEEIERYQEIKDTYGLSNKYNTVLGYGSGSVPTLQRRKGSEIVDMIVTLNDSLDSENKKVSSYFTTERVEKMPFLKNSALTKVLDGYQLTDEQTQNWRTYRSTFYEQYHNPISKLFIESYVK
ncbi:MAG: hypothetical protein K5925_00135 [Bacilli bacterium]|nr:hypothetical protein [Bacilli bacterium]